MHPKYLQYCFVKLGRQVKSELGSSFALKLQGIRASLQELPRLLAYVYFK